MLLSRHPGKCGMKKVLRVLELSRIKRANQEMEAYSFGVDLNEAPVEVCAEHTWAVAQADGTFLHQSSEACQVQKLGGWGLGDSCVYDLTRTT